MLGIAIPMPGMIIRFSSYFFSSALRKRYTPKKLAQMVEIRLDHEPSAITINCSELPDIEVRLSFKNTSPFHVTVHEFEVELYLQNRVASLLKISNRDIAPSAEEQFFVQTDLTEKQLDYINKHTDTPDPVLKVNAMLACRLSSFEISQREIPAQHIHFIDCNKS